MVSEEKRERLLKALDNLANGVDENLAEVKDAVGELTLNDIFDMFAELLEDEPVEEEKEDLQ